MKKFELPFFRKHETPAASIPSKDNLIPIPRHQEIPQSDLAKLAAETRKRDINNLLLKKKK